MATWPQRAAALCQACNETVTQQQIDKNIDNAVVQAESRVILEYMPAAPVLPGTTPPQVDKAALTPAQRAAIFVMRIRWSIRVMGHQLAREAEEAAAAALIAASATTADTASGMAGNT